MTPQAPDPMFAGWEALDWKERRERRYQRWLSAPGVEFQSEAARQDYTGRIRLLIDVLALKKPARVPVGVLVGFFTGSHDGLTKKEYMYDYQKSAAALMKFHEEFRPDFQTPPVAPAKVFEMLGFQFVDWPGHGLAENAPWQYREGEYMRADEYDDLIADPETYYRCTLLPRFGTAFAPLAGLDPFSEMMEATGIPFNILPFADPAVVEAVQKLADAARESWTYLMTTGAAGADAAARLGIPPMIAGLDKAPYDVLADTLRGTKGIVMDRFRQPEKILEASERLVPVMIKWGVRQVDRAGVPLITFVLHKGADSFMSEADFRTFYWPTLKKVMLGLIEQGVVPVMFAEGAYNKRLDIIADDDLPPGSVMWIFDQTDMAAAKRALGRRAAIAGNVPTALLALSTPEAVRDYVTDLLDTCARDGGFLLFNGAVLDDAKAGNLKTMIETGRDWRG